MSVQSPVGDARVLITWADGQQWALDADDLSASLVNDWHEVPCDHERPCAAIHRELTGQRHLTITSHNARTVRA